MKIGIQFCCGLCQKGFSTGANLRVHVENVHKSVSGEGENRYKCEKCEKSFKFKKSLNFHNESKHERKMKLSTSIYDLVLIYVCLFHHHFQ